MSQVAVKGRLGEADVTLLPHSSVWVFTNHPRRPLAQPHVRGAAAHPTQVENIAKETASQRADLSLFATVSTVLCSTERSKTVFALTVLRGIPATPHRNSPPAPKDFFSLREVIFV